MVFMWPFMMGWRGDTARTLTIAQGLVSRGWEVELLAGPILPEGAAAADIDPHFPGPVHRVDLPLGPAPARWPKAAQTLWNCVNYLPVHRRWAQIAAREYQRRTQGESPPSVVCAYTIHDDLQAVGCALHLSKAFGIPWAWELRDPYPSVTGKRPDPASRAIFGRVLKGSGRLITTTEALARHLEATHPNLSGRCATVHHCFTNLPQRRPAANAGEVLEFLHAGTLYSNRCRSAAPLVRALGFLLDQRPEARGRVRLTLLGPGKGAEEPLAMATSLGIADHLRVLPTMPPGEAQQLMGQASVLVVIKHASPAYDMQIPGKLFQYLGAGRPILVLAHESEAAEIARRSGLGRIAPPDDPSAIATALQEYWDDRHSLEARYAPDRDYIQRFSCDAMLDRLESILRP